MNSRFSQTLEHLLQDPAFISWTKGEKPQDDLLWEHWAAEAPDRQEILEKAKEFVHAVEWENRLVSDKHIERKIAQALKTAKQIEIINRKNAVSRFPMSVWSMAASLLIALGIGFTVLRIYKNHTVSTQNQPVAADTKSIFKTVTNESAAVKYVRLPDGSSIVLQKNSTVQFPEHFEKDKREVYLLGDAFFEVVKNPDQPFFVYANELVAKVHGTSFSIQAEEKGEQVVVAVKTGKVSVFAKDDSKAKDYETDKTLSAMLLTCNEQVTFERSGSKLVRSTAKSPVLLHIPIEKQVFTYSETPVSEVFASLAKAYGVDIHYDKAAMAHCSITATLGDEPLENKLKWICAILEAEYDTDQEKISIKGNPCQ
ncbi:FecR family protein [Dyadobacter luticola]|uniref:DUF4974 domain-containing protein n=1 Tax=Dyadobacter luticola TaxID=1979387 RepID=A0A5R9KST1_9BACT|nr:FecR family protein [Dyadobacter luticola]TLU99331.1 DUF4974 domain-containing protein [Dyadobacter luticola]